MSEDFKPKDHVIIDKGASNEDEGYVYMTGPTIAAINNMDGDRYRIPKSRLTHFTDGTILLSESQSSS